MKGIIYGTVVIFMGKLSILIAAEKSTGESCIAWEKTNREFTDAEHAHAHCTLARERCLPKSKVAADELQDDNRKKGVPLQEQFSI